MFRGNILSSLSILCLSLAGCYQSDDSPGRDDQGDDGGDETTGSSSDTNDPDTSGGATGSNDDDGGTDTGVPADSAAVRVIHGSPDAPAVDIYAQGIDEPVITNLSYGQTSAYLEVPEGTYNFQVRPAGASAEDDPVYQTGALELPGGARISALAAGLLGGQNASNRFRVVPLVESFAGAGAGEAMVRVVHAGSDAPAVDLDLGDDGSAEITGLGRFEDTGEAGVLVPSGTALQVGIQVDGERVTAFTTPELPDGAELFVVATGLLGKLPREQDGFSLLAVGFDGSIGFVPQNPTVYALHAGSDAPEVDICVGDTPLATHFGFGEIRGFQVPPGEYTLDIYPAPSACFGTPVRSDVTPMLTAGNRYLAIATGELSPSAGEPPLVISAFRDAFDLDADGSAVTRIVHSASAPAVDIGVVTGGVIEGGNVLVSGLKWPNASNQLELAPLTYQVGVAAAGGSPPIHPLASFHVPALPGMRAFVVAAGDLSPELGEAGFRLLAIDTAESPWTVTPIFAN